MRRSVQPNWPRAMTCRFFASLKMFAMPAEGRTPPPPRQRLERLLPMAGFQLSIYGGFWVSTEAFQVAYESKDTGSQALRDRVVEEWTAHALKLIAWGEVKIGTILPVRVSGPAR